MPDINNLEGFHFSEVKDLKTFSNFSVFESHNEEIKGSSISLLGTTFSLDIEPLREDLEDRLDLMDGYRVIANAVAEFDSEDVQANLPFNVEVHYDDGVDVDFRIENISNVFGTEKAQELAILKFKSDLAEVIEEEMNTLEWDFDADEIKSVIEEADITITVNSTFGDSVKTPSAYRKLEDSYFKIDILNMLENGDYFNTHSSVVLKEMIDKFNFDRSFDENLSIHFEFEEGDVEAKVIVQGEESKEDVIAFKEGFEERFSRCFAEALCETDDSLNFETVVANMANPDVEPISKIQVGISNYPTDVKIDSLELCFETSFVESAVDDFFDDNVLSFQTPYQGHNALEKTAEILRNTKSEKWSIEADYDSDDLDVRFEMNDTVTLDGSTAQELVYVVDDALKQAVAELSGSSELLAQVEKNRIVSNYVTKEFPDLDTRMSVLSGLKEDYKLESKGKARDLDASIGMKELSAPAETRPFEASTITLSEDLKIKLDKVQVISEKKARQNVKARLALDANTPTV